MLQQPAPDDYVIATGESNPLEDFVAETFNQVGLDWHDHVDSDPTLLRPTELMVGRANPAKALNQLGWAAHSKMRDVARLMVESGRAYRA